MKTVLMLCFMAFIGITVSGCSWYKGPPLQANANGSLDGSSLNETSGPGFVSTLESADDYGSSDTGYADDGGNYDVTSFDNV